MKRRMLHLRRNQEGAGRLVVHLSILLTASLCVWTSRSQAQAECPRYELSELVTTTLTEAEARAINPRHQAIGGGTKGSSTEYAVRWRTLRDAPELLSPAVSSAAFGLASNGLVAGQIMTAEGARGAVWDREGNLRWLPPLRGHDESTAFAVNAHGAAVGASSDTNGQPIAVRWDPRSPVTSLPRRDAVRSVALAINDRDDIVGYEELDSPAERRAVRWTAGGRRVLHGLGGGFDTAEAIDSSGRFVVGSSSRAEDGETQAVVWTAHTTLVLGHPSEARASAAHGVNSKGTAVGDIINHDGTTVAAMWEGGRWWRLVDLVHSNDSTWNLVSARAINDAGEIVGYGRRRGEPELHAFVLRPLSMRASEATCRQSEVRPLPSTRQALMLRRSRIQRSRPFTNVFCAHSPWRPRRQR